MVSSLANSPVFKLIRRVLDGLYMLGGIIGALFLIAILGLILIQMLARWTGEVFPGAPDFAGYCMAGASFFAFAYALNHGAHIRVSLVLTAMGRWRRWGEVWCFGVGSAIACYFSYYAVLTTIQSRQFNDISQGQDAWPIWIPQLSMAVGSILLAVCFIDNFIKLLFAGDHNIKTELVKEQAAD
ncbi:MAG: TRAP transporter small permease [Pseudomonadota bacterium]